MQAWAREYADPGERIAAYQDEIEEILEYLASALPSKNVDSETGAKRFVVYVSILAHCTKAELQHMSLEACRTLNWFPTPKQCLDLVATYLAPASERDTVLRLCSDFAQEAFDRWLENVRDGQEIGDVPERWMRIAVERGVMRRLSNGAFVSRALYQGPTKRIAV